MEISVNQDNRNRVMMNLLMNRKHRGTNNVLDEHFSKRMSERKSYSFRMSGRSDRVRLQATSVTTGDSLQPIESILG